MQITVGIIIAIYIIVSVILGTSSVKHARTSEGFLLGSRNVGPWLSAFSYGTAYFSAVIFIGYAGMFGFKIGIGSIWIGVGNALIGTYLSWKLLAERTRFLTHKHNAKTIPEFFSNIYKSRGMKIYAALIIFIFLVPYASGVYKGLGLLFSMVFNGVNPVVCMVIVAGLTAVYLVLGGYTATARNDLFQGLIMIIGLVALIVIVFSRKEVSGLGEFLPKLSNISEQLTSITGGQFSNLLLVNILLTSFGVFGMPQMVSKYYSIKDEKSIKIATKVSTVFALVIGVGAYSIGSVSPLFIKANADGTPALADSYDGVIPTILMDVLSSNTFTLIVLGVIVVLLLSASMSTLSSLVLSSASAVSIDIFGEIKKISEKKEVLIMRIFCVIFIAASFIFATLNITFIVNLMSFSWGVVAGAFIGPFLFTLFCKNLPKPSIWIGLISGPFTIFTLFFINFINIGFDETKAMMPWFGVIAMAVSFLVVPLSALVINKGKLEFLKTK